MDRQLIKTLIDALAASDLSELEYSSGDATLRLVKGIPGGVAGVAGASDAALTTRTPPPPRPSPEVDAGVISAPCYGIVHLHRGPDAPPLVTSGMAVSAGQVLCLIEAMKVFTELRADRAGTVSAVLVATGQEVESGQPLFELAA